MAGRIRFTDYQGADLLSKLKSSDGIDCGALLRFSDPKTLLKWHRRLSARKYNGSAHRTRGRPEMGIEIRDLILRMAKAAKENRTRGALASRGRWRTWVIEWKGAR